MRIQGWNYWNRRRVRGQDRKGLGVRLGDELEPLEITLGTAGLLFNHAAGVFGTKVVFDP